MRVLVKRCAPVAVAFLGLLLAASPGPVAGAAATGGYGRAINRDVLDRLYQEPDSLADDCGEMLGWLIAVNDRMERVQEANLRLSQPGVGLADLADIVDEYEGLAEEQEESDPPPAAEDANDALIDFFTAMAEFMEAAGANDQAASTAAGQRAAAALQVVVAELAEVEETLTETCGLDAIDPDLSRALAEACGMDSDCMRSMFEACGVDPDCVRAHATPDAD